MFGFEYNAQGKLINKYISTKKVIEIHDQLKAMADLKGKLTTIQIKDFLSTLSVRLPDNKKLVPFMDMKQVEKAHHNYLKFEIAFNEGLVLCLDQRDASESHLPHQSFVKDKVGILEMFCLEDCKKHIFEYDESDPGADQGLEEDLDQVEFYYVPARILSYQKDFCDKLAYLDKFISGIPLAIWYGGQLVQLHGEVVNFN